MEEAKSLLRRTLQAGPVAARRLKHCVSTENVRYNETARTGNRTILVAFGGKLQDRTRTNLLEQSSDCHIVANISFYKCVAWIRVYDPERIEIARVGQFVDIDDLYV